jgi:hypothetical protein
MNISYLVQLVPSRDPACIIYRIIFNDGLRYVYALFIIVEVLTQQCNHGAAKWCVRWITVSFVSVSQRLVDQLCKYMHAALVSNKYERTTYENNANMCRSQCKHLYRSHAILLYDTEVILFLIFCFYSFMMGFCLANVYALFYVVDSDLSINDITELQSGFFGGLSSLREL